MVARPTYRKVVCDHLGRWVARNRRPGLVLLFFIQGSHEEIPDESGPKTPQLILPFFVERPNEEIPDHRRSTAAHNLSTEATD